MKRRDFLKSASIALVSLASINLFAKPLKRRPNIVLFYVDDLGYGDVGYHGCKDVPTPHIDSIANNGVQFSAAYVTAPVCGPSRAGLLTGRYQQRFGFEDNPGPFRQSPDTKIGIPDTEKTIGYRMKALGYRTAFIGKNHAGKDSEGNPLNQGFDFFFGFDNGASNYFIGKNKKKMLMKGRVPVEKENEYLTDAFGRESVSFIDKNMKEPFYLYLPFNAVHAPMQAPEEIENEFSDIADPGRRTFAAMLTSIDRNVGKVLKKLRSCGIEDNTLVIFTSDNGGAAEKSNYSLNGPLRDIKGSFYEGGIRVPFCVQWKAAIKPGQKYDFQISTLDILPTSISAAGGQISKSWKLDGIDLMPYMLGEAKQPPQRYLYWRLIHGWAINDGEWKLVKSWGGRNWDHNRKPELYHISSDIGEKNDLIKKRPDIAGRLQKEWNRWSSEMIPPQWGWQEVCGKYKVPLD